MNFINRIIHNLHFGLVVSAYRFYSYLLRVDNNLIAFSSDVDYSDNSRALYEYLIKKRDRYHFVWLLKQNHIPDKRERTEFVRLYQSFRSVYLLAKAKYIFYTHPLGKYFKPRREQIVVNLWHGIPIKGIKGAAKVSNPQFNYLLCLGDNNVSTSAMFVGCDESLVRPWGYPRLDILFSSKDYGYKNPFVPNNFCGKVIIWMPTFRKSIAKSLSESSVDSDTGLPLLIELKQLDSFNSFLFSINVMVILKIHHLQAQKDVFKREYSNIIILQDKDILSKGYQLYDVVAKTDALLTDYSSISIDYMLMNRPIGYILDDLKQYEKSRGAFMYSPVTDYLGGVHIYNYDELVKFCLDVSNGIDTGKDFREKVKLMMIKFPDGSNCERIVNKLNM